MIMADISSYVAIALAFVLALPAMWMAFRGLWPEAFAKRVEIAKAGLFKSFLLGLLTAGIITLVIFVFAKRLGPVPGFLVAGCAIAVGLAGLAGYATLIGERLWQGAEGWKQTRNGGMVLICATALPFIGWFLMLPLLAIVGLGVNVRSRFVRSANTQPASHVEA